MSLDTLEIKINGKDYKFLKPFPITLMQIEADCVSDDGRLDYDKWNRSMLRLVSKELKVEDLVKYNETKVVLENGNELIPTNVSYVQYINDYRKLKKGIKDIVGTVDTYLKYCGLTNYDLNTLSYKDIWAIMDAYSTMFDESELNRVLDAIDTFR